MHIERVFCARTNLPGLFINSQIKLNLADVNLRLLHIQTFQRGRGEA
jgi:hypothetical protein